MSAAGDGGLSPAAVRVKEEREWVEIDIEYEKPGASLYTEHEVKRELALGPEPRSLDDADASQESLNNIDTVTVKQELKSEKSPETELSGEAPPDRSCEEQYSSGTCSVKFERLSTDEEQHTCLTCHKTFDQECSLTSHRCIGSEEASCSNIVISKEVIEHCTKQLINRAKSVKHGLMHTEKQPYSCEICKKQFTRNTGLTSHKLIHTGQKPYSCEICKKQFTQKSNLASHMILHTGDKPYSCEICKRQFTRRSNLATHRLIHTGEKPYSCAICKKQLMRSNSLASHMLIHTGENLHSCEICKKQFTLRSSLVKHKLTHTVVKPVELRNTLETNK